MRSEWVCCYYLHVLYCVLLALIEVELPCYLYPCSLMTEPVYYMSDDDMADCVDAVRRIGIVAMVTAVAVFHQHDTHQTHKIRL